MRTTDTHIYFFTSKDLYSNFYYSPFKHQDHLFKWAEQAIMWRKAKLFGANDIASKILLAQSAHAAKMLGRSKDIPFDQKIWDAHKMAIFEEVLFDKFSIPHLRNVLIAEKEKTFVEASPYDRIWGCGLAEDDDRILDEKNWKGQNLLGKALKNVQLKLLEVTT